MLYIDSFWQLMRLGLWPDSIPADISLDEQNWQRLIKAAMANGVHGIVADGIQRLPANKRPSDQLTNRLVGAVTRNIMAHYHHNATITEIWRMMENANIHPTLLKGQGNARHYHNPYARSCGDIDLYIGLHDFDRAVEHAQSLGIACEEDIADNIKHVNFTYNGTLVELHRYAIIMSGKKRNRAFQKWADEAFGDMSNTFCINDAGEYATSGTSIAMPTPTFNVFFLFYHALKHFLSPYPSLKQFADIAVYLHANNGSINRQLLGKKLAEYKLMESWQRVGAFLVEYMGLPKDDFPHYSEDAAPYAARIAEVFESECLDLSHRKSSHVDKSLVKQKLGFLRACVSALMRNRRIFPAEARREFAEMLSMGFYQLRHGLIVNTAR